MLDPNLSKTVISDEEIINEFKNPVKYKRAHLYSIMAMRANENPLVKTYLFEIIKDKEKREKLFVGSIIHAWLPVLHILQNGNNQIKKEMKLILGETWSEEEKRLFLNYVKKHADFYSLVKDM